MESDYFIKLSPANKKQYNEKLKTPKNKQLPDPYAAPSHCLSSDITKLPDITWRDVTYYLIESPSIYTKESLKAYKSLDAFNYFVSGHVQDCFYNGIADD